MPVSFRVKCNCVLCTWTVPLKLLLSQHHILARPCAHCSSLGAAETSRCRRDWLAPLTASLHRSGFAVAQRSSPPQGRTASCQVHSCHNAACYDVMAFCHQLHLDLKLIHLLLHGDWISLDAFADALPRLSDSGVATVITTCPSTISALLQRRIVALAACLDSGITHAADGDYKDHRARAEQRTAQGATQRRAHRSVALWEGHRHWWLAIGPHLEGPLQLQASPSPAFHQHLQFPLEQDGHRGATAPDAGTFAKTRGPHERPACGA